MSVSHWVRGANGNTICLVSTRDEQRAAPIKLIAAAPEMLEALVAALDELNGMGCRVEVCLMVEKAINKAAGAQ